MGPSLFEARYPLLVSLKGNQKGIQQLFVKSPKNKAHTQISSIIRYVASGNAAHPATLQTCRAQDTVWCSNQGSGPSALLARPPRHPGHPGQHLSRLSRPPGSAEHTRLPGPVRASAHQLLVTPAEPGRISARFPPPKKKNGVPVPPISYTSHQLTWNRTNRALEE